MIIFTIWINNPDSTVEALAKKQTPKYREFGYIFQALFYVLYHSI